MLTALSFVSACVRLALVLCLSWYVMVRGLSHTQNLSSHISPLSTVLYTPHTHSQSHSMMAKSHSGIVRSAHGLPTHVTSSRQATAHHSLTDTV